MASVLPPLPPEPIKQTWIPGVDPLRTDRGPVLWRGPQGNAVNPGDILPNLQDAFRPVARPREVWQERGGYVPPEELEAQEAINQGLVNNQLVAAMNPLKTAGQVLQSAKIAIRQAGPAGVGLAGIPEGIMRAASIPAESTERLIGAASQANQFQPDLVQLVTRRVAGPVMLRTGAALARAVGAEKAAANMEQAANNPSLFNRLLAESIATGRANGRDTSDLESFLEMSAPRHEVERLVEQEARYQAATERDTSFVEKWNAGHFTFEGSERVMQALERIERGEDWETISTEIEADLSGTEIWRDVVGQVVYDPLNLLDFGLKIGPIGGGVAERVRKATAANMAEYLVAVGADEGLEVVEKYGARAAPTLLERLPGLAGDFFNRLPATRAAQLAEESASVTQMALEGIHPEASARLARAGIGEHPRVLALAALLDPDAADLARTGRAASEIREMLGLGPRLATEYDIATLGVPEGAALDLFRSRAANRTREALSKTSTKGLAESYDAIREAFREGSRGNLAAREAAEVEISRWFGRLDSVWKDIIGYKEPTGVLAKAKATNDSIQGIFAKYFHIGPNFGTTWRNMGNNIATLMLDGLDFLSPRRRVRDEMARLGILTPGMGRSLGAQVDVLAGQKRNIVDRLMIPLRLSRDFERHARMRATYSGFTRVLRRDWQVGRAIPDAGWASVERVLGEQAPAARALIERAWDSKSLSQVTATLTADEPWRVINDPALMGRLMDLGIDQDALDLLREADSLADLTLRADDYVAAMGRRVEDVAQMQPPLAGTAEADVHQAMLDMVNMHGEKAGQEFYNDFWKQQAERRALAHQAENYARLAVSELNNTQPERVWEHANRLIGLATAERGAMEGIRPFQIDAWGLLHEGKLEELRALAAKTDISASVAPLLDELAAVQTAGEARLLNYQIAETYWSEFWAKQVPDYLALGDEVAEMAAVKLPRPDQDAVRRLVPLTSPEQRRMFAELQQLWRQEVDPNGSVVYLRNFLQKHGPLESDRFFSADILNEQWYDEAVQAIRDHGKKAEIGKLDEAAEAVGILPTPPESAGGADMLAQTAARQIETQRALQDVLGHAAERSTLVKKGLTDSQVAALNAFIREIEPRLTGVRGVAKQVGDVLADFAVHNYGDKRGFDLMMGTIFNYPYWYSRTLANFVKRGMQTPGSVAALMKAQMALERINRDKPEWFRDQVTIQTASGPMYLPLMQAVNPLNGFLGSKFRDADLYNTVPGAFLAEAQQYGPGLHASIATTMAVLAHLRDDKEEALGWMGYLGGPTRGINALTVLARAAGADFIPPGGYALESLWLDQAQNGEYRVYDKWEAKSIGVAMAGLIGQEVNGQVVTREQAMDAMLQQGGPLFDEAIQQAKLERAIPVLSSWLLGAGFRPRPEISVEVAEFDQQRVALMGAKDDMTPEQYRQAWAEMRQLYPWADLVMGFRRDRIDQLDTYAWSVFNRMPPNAKPYWEALGVDSDVYGSYLDQFYADKGLGGMNDLDQQSFMLAMTKMGAILALPEQATAEEWDAARAARRAMNDRLEAMYPGTRDLETAYFDTLRRDGQEAADLILQQHPEVGERWDDKDRLVNQDPLLSQYYGSMDTFERMLKDDFEDRMEQDYPGLHADLDRYYALPQELRADFLEANPHLGAYWSKRDAWTVMLDEELAGLADPIRALTPRWATLRPDAEFQTVEQRSVAELIASGSRPMGDFELPEDLSAKQVQSAISLEISSIPEGQWGTVYKALKAAGDLDDVFTAYLEWGRGGGGAETIQANILEARALLAALGMVREASGWALAEADGKGGLVSKLGELGRYEPARYAASADGLSKSSGGGGGSGGAGGSPSGGAASDDEEPRRSGGSRTVRSSTYGGASGTAPEESAVNAQQQQQIGQFLTRLRHESPTFWGWLRNLADMSREDAATFLADPAHAHFRAWLVRSVQPVFGTDMVPLLEYFRQRQIPPVRPQYNFRRGAGSQRWAVKF